MRTRSEPIVPGIAASYRDDESGRLVEATLELRTTESLYAVVNVLSSSGEYVKGVEGYQDRDGDFVMAKLFCNRTCALYIPFSALRYGRAGKYSLCVTPLSADDDNTVLSSFAPKRFEFSLPQPRSWCKITYLLPLIGLAMAVVRAEGSIVPDKLRCLKESMIRNFSLTSEQAFKLRDALKTLRPKEVPALVAGLGIRFPGLTTRSLLMLLTDIAKSDGDLSAAEMTILRSTASARGMPDEEWQAFVTGENVVSDDSWSILELSPGATPDEIKSAFRRKISRCHPDRFTQHPKEFQDLATKQTIAVKQAYDHLMARCAQRA